MTVYETVASKHRLIVAACLPLRGGTMREGAEIDFNDGYFSRCAYGDLKSGGNIASPSTGFVRVGARSGLLRIKPFEGHIKEYGALVYEGTSGSSGLTIDVSDIDDTSFANGIFIVRVTTLVTPVANENRSYGEERRYFIYRNYDNSTWNTVHMVSYQSWDPDGYHIGTVTLSGSTLTLSRNSGTPYSDARRYTIFCELTAKTKT